MGFFLISENQDIYRGVSCHLKQVSTLKNNGEFVKPFFDYYFFQISPLASINGTNFDVRKELTPVSGNTKCSIYLQNKLDYEVHSSFIMQIIAEVCQFMCKFLMKVLYLSKQRTHFWVQLHLITCFLPRMKYYNIVKKWL